MYGAVSTPEKAEYARAAFGYDEVFVRDGFPAAVRAATAGRGVDMVLDPVGGPTRLASLDVLGPCPSSRWKNNRTLTGYNIGDLGRRGSGPPPAGGGAQQRKDGPESERVLKPVRRVRTRPFRGRSGGLGAAAPRNGGVEGAAAPGDGNG